MGRPKGSQNKSTIRLLAETSLKMMRGKGLSAMTAAEVLAMLDEPALWLECKTIALEQQDGRLLLAMLSYLTDKRDGRAPQSVHVTANVVHHKAEDLKLAREIAREIIAYTEPKQLNDTLEEKP